MCEATNYGRFAGAPGYTGHEQVLARLVRAYFLGDDEWFQEELEIIGTLSTPQMAPPVYCLPKGQWGPLFNSLFFGTDKEFEKNFKKAAKWYRGRVEKQHCNYGGIMPVVWPNYLLLPLAKIAISYLGRELDIPGDPLLPRELIVLE